MTFSEIPIRFLLLRRESNIENYLRWFEYIAGPDFADDWKRSLETNSSMNKRIQSARQVVEDYIYAHNTTSGTGRIRRSISATAVESEELSANVVYSDPAIAPAKGPTGDSDPGKFSYAAFFEDPRFNTFLPPKDNPTDSRRYRPFFQPMTMQQKKVQEEIAVKTLMQTISKRMPRT